MSEAEVLQPRWSGLVIVAAPGPSLTKDVAEACRCQRVLAIGEAWQRLPWAEVLYHADFLWWQTYRGCADFKGEKWSTVQAWPTDGKMAREYGVRLIPGQPTAGFSRSPRQIHYGGYNSGFQGVNLAILWGATEIVLVGFDMRGVQEHFFKNRPSALQRKKGDCVRFVPYFEQAAKHLPEGVRILNATPGSALKCFPMVRLEDVL